MSTQPDESSGEENKGYGNREKYEGNESEIKSAQLAYFGQKVLKSDEVGKINEESFDEKHFKKRSVPVLAEDEPTIELQNSHNDRQQMDNFNNDSSDL